EGLAADGAFETIDNATFNITRASSTSYQFGSGAARRYVGELSRRGITSVQIIPGGGSGVAGNRLHTKPPSSWLTNDYHRVLFTDDEIDCERFSQTVYTPSN